jgi:TetR/AcrR family transcriptional regulator, cholesterol catabolism regulator
MSTDSRGRAARLVRGGGQGYASSSIIERRRRILTTARKMIASDGISAVNMDEISRRADVAKRTLYNAFQSKERLIAAAIQQYFEDYEVELVYSTPAATAERMAEHLSLVAHRNLSIRNYTRALVDVYYSPDVEPNIRHTIGEIVAHSHRPWIDRLHTERQLQPWITRDTLVDDLTRYRYAVASDWVHGRIADEMFPSTLIVGVMTMMIGATKPRVRRECEDVLKELERFARPRGSHAKGGAHPAATS